MPRFRDGWSGTERGDGRTDADDGAKPLPTAPQVALGPIAWPPENQREGDQQVVGDPWPAAVERFGLQLDRARAAAQRVEDAKEAAFAQSPHRDDFEPAEYERRRRAYVQTPQYKAASREIRVAVALSKAHDGALLRAAGTILTRRAGGKRAPRHLPRPRIVPGRYVPQWWMNTINATYAGIWRAIPSPGPELRLESPDDPLVQEVAKQARLLQASRVGYRKRDSLYESFIPDGTLMGGRSLPPIRGLSPEASRRADRVLGRSRGIRVQPGRDEEFDQLHTDYFAVWDRSRAYAAAVLALLQART
ncbi:hypothetical protein GCM10010377_76150 [Streptomyces viridiviolaceus]|uniref:Uncharacterized protein n=1 Tax=Streptomyces viridiviolaceus TaxID=68282 RepID=A0ABW2DV91_9ACTN|nr:hypothetical protein [Streptomyces viridiviolaceus]GHB74464.1 hypothetical protein GCM10010377_76150 [Streptomyces viridiviolaceus]